MKKVGRFVNKLSVRIITMIILSVTLLSVVSGFFTYQVFSTIMLNETYHTLEQIADSSTYEIAKWNIFSSFLVAGVEDFEEIAGLDEEELEERLGSKVYLETFVRVEPDWRNRVSQLQQFGYLDSKKDE